MKSKTLSYIVASLAIGTMLASCSSTSNQMSSSFGSRKYTKGVFLNTPATVGTIEANATTKAVTPAESAKPSVTEATVKPSVTATANVGAAKTGTEQTLPVTTVKKNTFSSLVAAAKTKAAAKVAGPSNYFNTEKVAGIETTAQVKRGGGGTKFIDFQDHPVRTVLFILLAVLIIALLVFAAANGALTVTAGA